MIFLWQIVAKLGFSIALCCSDATHFVTDRFVRTRNMLESVALGKPVVTHLWLEGCEQAGYVIDEKNYILRDEKKEKEIGFNMPVSLTRASQHPLLKVIDALFTFELKLHYAECMFFKSSFSFLFFCSFFNRAVKS